MNTANTTTLKKPSGVAVAPNGHLFVADDAHNRVLSWSSASGFSNRQAPDITIKGLHAPESVAVDSSSNLYVADRVDLTIGQRDTADDCTSPSITNFCSPRGLTFVDNKLYVADEFHHRIVIFNDPLNTDTTADLIIGQWGCGMARSSAQFCVPVGVAVDGSGNLYVVEHGNYRLTLSKAPLSNGMTASCVFGQSSFTAGPTDAQYNHLQQQAAPTARGPYWVPLDVVLDSAGNLFVSDTYNNRILVYLNPLDCDAADVGIAMAAMTADYVFGQSGAFDSTPAIKVDAAPIARFGQWVWPSMRRATYTWQTIRTTVCSHSTHLPHRPTIHWV
jgi:hypothetical protein